MNSRNAVLISVAVVALGAATWLLFAGARDSAPDHGDESFCYGVCLNCKAEDRYTYPRGDVPPFVCHSCGQQAVYPLFYCTNCGKLFVPVLDTSVSPPRIPLVPWCTECGSSSVQPYYPEAMLDEPTGRAPLPKWPPK